MGIGDESKVLTEFFQSGWSDSYLDTHYFKAPNPLRATQFYVPVIPSTKAPEAFGVEKLVKPSYWLIHYKVMSLLLKQREFASGVEEIIFWLSVLMDRMFF